MRCGLHQTNVLCVACLKRFFFCALLLASFKTQTHIKSKSTTESNYISVVATITIRCLNENTRKKEKKTLTQNDYNYHMYYTFLSLCAALSTKNIKVLHLFVRRNGVSAMQRQHISSDWLSRTLKPYMHYVIFLLAVYTFCWFCFLNARAVGMCEQESNKNHRIWFTFNYKTHYYLFSASEISVCRTFVVCN